MHSLQFVMRKWNLYRTKVFIIAMLPYVLPCFIVQPYCSYNCRLPVPVCVFGTSVFLLHPEDLASALEPPHRLQNPDAYRDAE